jgi:hypothetical protein
MAGLTANAPILEMPVDTEAIEVGMAEGNPQIRTVSHEYTAETLHFHKFFPQVF